MAKKRKRHPDTVKARIAFEAVKGIKTLSEISSRYGIHPNQVSQWKKQLKEGAPEIFNRSQSKKSDQEKIISSLYEEIGRLKMENNWLKKKL